MYLSIILVDTDLSCRLSLDWGHDGHLPGMKPLQFAVRQDLQTFGLIRGLERMEDGVKKLGVGKVGW